jgi:Mg-chelatase subunit ChlD
MKKITRLISLVALCGALQLSAIGGAGMLWAAARTSAEEATQTKRPTVEVMFVLDTTGSMSGLIAAAKEKIWSIANTLASAKPAPVIRMGLVGYRDRGDQYITTFTDLSADLDAVYTRLMKFAADGGGDTPESVNQALFEAVNKPSWSEGAAVYRVIFLVGDAPPHMNYRDDVPYGQSCKKAVSKGIVINTIQCGDIQETTPIWQAIARQAEGQFFKVAQSGSAVLYETPYDRKIADLSRTLDDTRIYYGDSVQQAKMEERKRSATEIYRAAAPSAVAKRTIFNAKEAGAKNFLGEQELVEDVATGRVAPEKIKKEELPAELRGLSEADLKERISERIKTRKALQGEINQLAKQRQAFIMEKVREDKEGGAKSLDVQIFKCIEAQAGQKDIRYTDGPEY